MEATEARIEKLKDKNNYYLWKFQVTVHLKSYNAFNVASGVTKRPERVEDQDEREFQKSLTDWEKKDGVAQRVVTSTIESKLLVHIMTCNTASEMWSKLESLFEKDSKQNQVDILEEFFMATYERGTSITMHVAKLENIYNRLKFCGKTGVENKTITEDMLVCKILATLPEKMNYFKTAWGLTPTSEKTLSNLRSKLMEEEERSVKPKEESMAFFSNNKGKSKFNGPKNGKNTKENLIKCYRCNKYGNHIAKNCPEQKNDNDQKGNMWCSRCRKSNHTDAMCFYRKKDGDKDEKGGPRKKFTFMSNNSNFNEDDEENNTWIVDSGATSHITNNDKLFTTFDDISEDIGVAKKGTGITATKIGDIETSKLIIQKVRFSNEVPKNLLSVDCITKKGGNVHFDKDEVIISKDNQIILRGKRNENGLFTVNLGRKEALMSCYEEPDWHRRMAHLSDENILRLQKMSKGLNLNKSDACKNKDCDVCIRTKMTKKKFDNNRERATRVLQLVHSDVCGPINPPTYDDKNYFITLIDDYSGFTMLRLLEYKSEACDAVKEMMLEMETQQRARIEKFRSDNAKEYVCDSFKQWCKNRGIVMDLSPPYCPELNGNAERKNLTIMNKARALMSDSGTNQDMWGEAVLCSVFLANRSPMRGKEKTPYEFWFQKTPDLKYIRIFGCVAYSKNTGYIKKLDDRAAKYMFVGYAPNAYRLFDPIRNKIIISRDVKFIESTPYCEKKPTQNNETYFGQEEEEEESEREERGEAESEKATLSRDNSMLDSSESTVDSSLVGDTEYQPGDLELEGGTNRRYPVRERRPTIRFADQQQQLSYMMESNEIDVPTTVEEAKSSPEADEWQRAMQDEYNSLIINKTWELVDLPQGRTLVDNKWVFALKRDSDNNIKRYKCRLVAKGFSQKAGIDFNETFSPVIKHSTLRLFFSIAAETNEALEHIDVETAFLNGVLEEEVFMRQPDGFIDKENKNKVCRLYKAIYGLKQASYVWNKRVDEVLLNFGLKKSKLEPCVYFSVKNNSFLIIGVYVDDFLLISNDKIKKQSLKAELEKHFKIKDLGPVKQILGINVTKDEKTGEIKLDQKHYIESIMKRFNMEECKPVATPMEVKNKMLPERENLSESRNIPYQNLIGSIMYLTVCTRPDLAFTASYLSQYNNNPTEENWKQAKRVLRYLKGTAEMGLVFKKSEKMEWNGYVDADWGGDERDRKSYTGFIFKLGNNVIEWESRKQKTVALSSTEAEYMAISEASKQAIFLKNLYSEIFSDDLNTIIFNDNQSAKKLTENSLSNNRTKHIDIRYHFIKDVIKQGILSIEYMPTDEMPADLLTKPLCKVKHNKCLKDIMS